MKRLNSIKQKFNTFKDQLDLIDYLFLIVMASLIGGFVVIIWIAIKVVSMVFPLFLLALVVYIIHSLRKLKW